MPADAVGYICRQRCLASLWGELTYGCSSCGTVGQRDDGRRFAAVGRAFWACLATQFLTALNDNIFRWLVIGIGKDHVPVCKPRRSGW